MEEKESPLPSILLIVLFCTLIVLLGYAYLFNNDFFYSFCGGKSFWCSASQLLCSFPLFFILSIFVISADVLYDVLRGAPLLSTSNGQLSLFARRGATVVEGLVYGVLGHRFLQP